MQTSRDIVKNAIQFNYPERLPVDLPDEYGSDFFSAGMTPSPDIRPKEGKDEWGAIWYNIGVSNLGEVKEFPLKSWDDLSRLTVPDILAPHRWEGLRNIRQRAGDKFILGWGISIYERVHFLRGLENTWVDIYEEPEKLCKLIDLLVEMNLVVIEQYAKAGVDALVFTDDWGLQDRLMISPDSWREIWKPRYARIFQAAHKAGLHTILHSCGDIASILDDLIEAGLDVIQMDQQENMGLENLGKRFGGRITFYCPVDIQNTMVKGTTDDIRKYCRDMVKTLGRPQGGFIAKWYGDPAAVGHRPEAIKAMSEEFVKIGIKPLSLTPT